MFSPLSAIRLCAFFMLWLGFSTPAYAAEPAAMFLPLPSPQPLPALVVRELSGREWGLAELVKKMRQNTPGETTLVLHLWATNCGPCQPEMRAIDEALPQIEQQGLKIIALAQDPDGSVTVPAFIKRHGIKRLPLYIDPTQLATKRLAPRGLPTSYLIDTQDRITAIHTGSIEWNRPDLLAQKP